MNTIKKILVPIDFSDYTLPVIEYAADLSKKYQAPLQIMHAYVTQSYVRPEGYIVLDPEQRDRTMASLQAQVDHVVDSATAAGAVGAAGSIVHGHVADAIVRVASDNACDLIVMGTHGRTGFKHMLMGSIAEHVVRAAPCPVLTVRAHAHAA